MSNSTEIFDILSQYASIKDDSEKIEEFVLNLKESYVVQTANILSKIIEQTFEKEIQNSLLIRKTIKLIEGYPNTFENDLDCLNIILNKMSSVIRNYRDDAVLCRKAISSILLSKNENINAAEILSPALVDENQRFLTANSKLDLNITIASIYLKEGSVKDAEIYINRASQLLSEAGDEQYQLNYKKIYATLLDMRGRYMEASQRFMELSLKPLLSDNETFLLRSTVSAILTPASPNRCKLLTNLYKDERCKNFPTYHVLEKMSMNRLVSKDEMEVIWSLLETYQQKRDYFNKVLIESNIISMSHVYSSISLTSAAELLDISQDDTEFHISEMLTEGRLQGSIDQLSGYVRFPKMFPLSAWDRKIEWICHSINSIVEKIETKHPDWCPNLSATTTTTGIINPMNSSNMNNCTITTTNTTSPTEAGMN